MERCEAADYLAQIRKLDRMIDNKLAEVSAMRELAMSVSGVSYDGVGGSMEPSDTVGSAVARIIEAERECDCMVDRLIDARREVVAVIERVDDARQYDVLHRYYVQGMTWAQVAEATAYSYPWVHELHNRGLDAVCEILDNAL